MTDGGTFNGKTVIGLGIPKVAKIYYEVQTKLLTSGSSYNDLYNALNQGCSNLVGTAGITADDCQQVRNATDAVEMNGTI
jgi:bacillolysin